MKEVYGHIIANMEDQCLNNTWCRHIEKLLGDFELEELWSNQVNHRNLNYKNIINTRLKGILQREMDRKRQTEP